MKRLLMLGTACGLMLLLAVPAHAQLNGSHTLGDFGVQSGSQPQPGFYTALFYLRYDTDTIKDADGETVRLPQTSPGSLAVSALAPMVWYVSKTKLFGANYGAMVVFPFANASIEVPAVQLTNTVVTSFSDMLIRPLDLGWHTSHSDVAAGLQLYMPTGRYERGGSDNIGKGMWADEPFVGATFYFDEKPDRQFRDDGLLGAPREEKGQRRQGRPASDASGRSRQVLPRRRADPRRCLLRAVEAHDRRPGRVRAPGWRRHRSGRAQQAQSIRVRAGRDAPGGQQVETLRPGQHPLSLGDRRAAENRRSDAGRHGNLPGAERQAQMS